MIPTRSDLEELSRSLVLVLSVGNESALEACQPLAFLLLPRRERTGNPALLKRIIIAEL